MLNMRKYLWLSLIIIPHLGYTLSWQDLWLNKNQQAQTLLNNNKPKQAAELFQDNSWKGVAYYKDKQYDKAYAEFQRDTSATGLYNQGNALAYLGRYDEAIHSYEQSLQIDANNADAKHNIEVLKKLKQQKEQQNQQQDKSQSSQNQQSDNGKGDSKQDKANDKSGNNKNDAKSQSDSAQNKSPDKADSNKDNSGQNKSENNSSAQNQANSKNNQQTNSANQNNKSSNSATNQHMPNEQNPTSQAHTNHQNAQQANSQQSNQASSQYVNPKDLRQEQQMQAILSQIPDDPGGLLRNKFMRDYQNEQQGSGQ